ncbi:hypothetical protein HAX54_032551 [Datura stramonium]|uniref:Uncharacterized protein n=1 Tax=Datura stramonium TaxID=4076 RepID=A0ABS8SCS9_DATST|nr:hypothetical protein [Datura stramonium]
MTTGRIISCVWRNAVRQKWLQATAYLYSIDATDCPINDSPVTIEIYLCFVKREANHWHFANPLSVFASVLPEEEIDEGMKYSICLTNKRTISVSFLRSLPPAHPYGHLWVVRYLSMIYTSRKPEIMALTSFVGSHQLWGYSGQSEMRRKDRDPSFASSVISISNKRDVDAPKNRGGKCKHLRF